MLEFLQAQLSTGRQNQVIGLCCKHSFNVLPTFFLSWYQKKSTLQGQLQFKFLPYTFNFSMEPGMHFLEMTLSFYEDWEWNSSKRLFNPRFHGKYELHIFFCFIYYIKDILWHKPNLNPSATPTAHLTSLCPYHAMYCNILLSAKTNLGKIRNWQQFVQPRYKFPRQNLKCFIKLWSKVHREDFLQTAKTKQNIGLTSLKFKSKR